MNLPTLRKPRRVGQPSESGDVEMVGQPPAQKPLANLGHRPFTGPELQHFRRRRGAKTKGHARPDVQISLSKLIWRLMAHLTDAPTATY